MPFEQADAKTIGHFELVDQLGVGTFGSVWMARDAQLDRSVAIKIPRKGQLDPGETEQFIREARAAAQLKHPNIVAVHEVGREDGHVYIVSDYVEGLTLADWLVGQQLTSRTAAELCLKLAEALHHAHEAGVIHRDLKPTNIILDRNNEPHIMDFGLAKREAGEVTMTMEGKVLGTPAYMSPEQARGEAYQADCRSDVYSLGVILYELLTGHKPFRGNVRMLLQQVINEDAPSPRKLNGTIPRDLETVCLKCLEKDPRKRYEHAQQLADELRRFLNGEPVHARPIGTSGKAWRWCKRNPIVATLGIGLALVLLTLAIVGPWVAVKQSQLVDEKTDLAEKNADLAAKESRAREQMRRQLYTSDMNLAFQRWTEGSVNQVVELLKRNEPQAYEEDFRGFEWYFLQRFTEQASSIPASTLHDKVNSVQFSSDGTLLAASGQHVLLFDARSPHSVDSFQPHDAEGNIGAMALSPTDSKLLTTVGGELRLWDLSDRSGSDFKPQRSWNVEEGAGPLRTVAFSANGHAFAVGGQRGVTLFDSNDPERDGRRLPRNIRGDVLAYSENMLAVADNSEGVKILLVDLTQDDICHELEGHTAWVSALDFSSDGQLLASGSNDNTVRLWNVRDKRELTTLHPGHRGPVLSVKFSPDETTLASLGADATVRLWDVERRMPLNTLKWKTAGRLVRYGPGWTWNLLTFSPTDGRLVAAGMDGTLKWWDREAMMEQSVTVLRDHEEWVHCVTFSPDGSLLASVGNDERVVKLWDVESGVVRREFSNFDTYPMHAAFSQKGEFLAVDDGNRIRLLRVDDWEQSVLDGPAMYRNGVKFSPDGRFLSASGWENETTVWAWPSRRIHARLTSEKGGGDRHAYSPDGRFLASTTPDGTLSILGIDSGEVQKLIDAHQGRVWGVAFSPDGHTLASWSGVDHMIRLWDTKEWVLRHEFRHTSAPWSLAFSPDGRTVAIGCADGVVRLWNRALREIVAELKGHRATVACVVFSPDGMTLASSGADATIRLWRGAKP